METAFLVGGHGLILTNDWHRGRMCLVIGSGNVSHGSVKYAASIQAAFKHLEAK